MVYIKVEEVRRFMYECFVTIGVNKKPALQQAELLAQTDRMGHLTHGLNRLANYIKDIEKKICIPNNEPEILKESKSTAWIDAHNCLGATASHFGVDTAMKKARDTGVGWVTVKGSNHNGMIGYWAKLCAEQGFIGLAFTNTSPLLVPTRSKKAALGTNPLAVCAPGTKGEIFYLEMATSVVALGAIEMYRKAKKPIPLGWALAPDGKPTRDPNVAIKTKLLLPLGGSEITSGYKGYGLSAAVEILTGISAGAAFAHHVRSWTDENQAEPANLGHCFAAIDFNCFAPGFAKRVKDCIRYWRNLPAVDPARPVLAPGDVEKDNAEIADRDGILYPIPLFESSLALAKKLNVKPMIATKIERSI